MKYVFPRAGRTVIIAAVCLLNSGCVGQIVDGVIATSFDVSRHLAVQSVKIPIDATEMGVRGVARAITKK